MESVDGKGGKAMGDIADDLTEQGTELWLDHLAGHPNIPDQCPYCEDELEAEAMIESE